MLQNIAFNTGNYKMVVYSMFIFIESDEFKQFGCYPDCSYAGKKKINVYITIMAEGKLTVGEIEVVTKVNVGQEELTVEKVKNIANLDFKVAKSEETIRLLNKTNTLFPTINVNMENDANGIVQTPNPLGKVPKNKFTGTESDIIQSGNKPKIRGNGGWTGIISNGESCEWKIWDTDKFYGNATEDTKLKAKDLEFVYFTLNELRAYKFRFVDPPKIKIVIDTGNGQTQTVYYTYNVQNFQYLNEIEISDAITFVASPVLENGVVSYLNGFDIITEDGDYTSLYDDSTPTGQPAPFDTVGNLVKQTYHSGLGVGGFNDGILQTVAETIDFFGVFDTSDTLHMRPLASSGGWRMYPLINFKTSEFKNKILDADPSHTIKSISLVADSNSHFTLSSAGVKFDNQVLQTVQFKDNEFFSPSYRLQYKYPMEWDEFMKNEHFINGKKTFPVYYAFGTLLHQNNIKTSTNFDDYTVSYGYDQDNSVYNFELRDCMLFYADPDSAKKIGELQFDYNGSIQKVDLNIKYFSHPTLQDKENEQPIQVGVLTGDGQNFFGDTENYTPVNIEWGRKYRIIFISDGQGNFGDVSSITFNYDFGLDWREHATIAADGSDLANSAKAFIGVDKPVPMVFNNTYPFYFIPSNRFSEYTYAGLTKTEVSSGTYDEIGTWKYPPYDDYGANTISEVFGVMGDQNGISVFYDTSTTINYQVVDDEDNNLIAIFREHYHIKMNGSVPETKLSGRHYYVHDRVKDTARPILANSGELQSVKTYLQTL